MNHVRAKHSAVHKTHASPKLDQIYCGNMKAGSIKKHKKGIWW